MVTIVGVAKSILCGNSYMALSLYICALFCNNVSHSKTTDDIMIGHRGFAMVVLMFLLNQD